MTPVATDDAVVLLDGVGKLFGRAEVLRSIDLGVHAGEVVGLVGPNGAGKSTLLSVIAGFSPPTTGRGIVLGRILGSRSSTPPLLGWMAERPAFVEHLSGRTNLRLLAGIRGDLGDAEVDAAMRATGLDPLSRKPVRAYSLGMRQRLSLTQALMEKPPLLLLDEPTNGLDPHGIVLLRESVRRAAGEGAAVLFASHLLAEVAVVSDRVCLIDGGRIVQEYDKRDALRLEQYYLEQASAEAI